MGSLLSNIRECLGLWKIIMAIFLFQFLLASTVGLQMQQVLDASIGNSLSIEKLKNGFNYTVFQDFVNVHGGSFSVLFGQMRWMVVTYLIFASFISAGSIYLLAREEKNIASFFQGGARYFGRFLLLDIIFALITLVFIGIGGGLVVYLFGIAPFQMDNEVIFLRWALLIGIVLIILISALIIWKIKTKYKFIREEETSLFQATIKGFNVFWASKWSLWVAALFFLGVSVLLSLINYALGDLPILPMIIAIQIIMFLKLLWRLVFYKTIGEL